MSEQRRAPTLAEQAAAWVPPWARTPQPDEQEVAASPEPEPASPAPPEPEPEQASPAPPEPEPEAEPPPSASEAALEPQAAPAPEATQPELDLPAASAEPELGAAQLRAALEAILLVVDEPVTEQTLAQVLDQPVARVETTLAELAAEYTADGRGFDLRRAAGGWRYYTRAEQAAYVERFVLDGQQARLTQAALETLAVVAYQQPVTRSRISAIRGVNCDGVIRTLLTRGLVEEAGVEPETGAHLYRTTSVFLEKLGLDSVDQLPPLAPFLPEDVESLDPDRRPAMGGQDVG